MITETPLVSIIIRSFNEGWALRGTLAAVQQQEYRNWELIVIDGGSTDDSVDLINSVNPRHFIKIKSHEYNPSRVMNQGMRLARSDFAIFLNADATPQGTNWLAPLVKALRNPQVGAVFGRQITRPDCEAVYACDYAHCFGPLANPGKRNHFFSMVSSGIRKEVWALRGFNEDMQYSEDDEFTRWCRAMGYEIAYVPESCVMHSHNYTPRQAARRHYGEGFAQAAVWEGSPRNINFFRTVLLGWVKDARRDFIFCWRTHRLSEWPHALHIRWRQRRARLAGFRNGWKRYRENPTNGHTNSPVWMPLSSEDSS